MEIGFVPALVSRITFTGDLGYEIWVKPEYQLSLYDLLLEAGEEFGLKHFGARALDSMRLEKGFGSWAREFRPIYGPFEAGLGHFVDLSKNNFIGRDCALREKENGTSNCRVLFTIEADGVDVIGDEPVWHKGNVIGWVTSGGFAHYSGASTALAYIPRTLLEADATGYEIEILGQRQPAKLMKEPLYDPQGERMRSGHAHDQT